MKGKSCMALLGVLGFAAGAHSCSLARKAGALERGDIRAQVAVGEDIHPSEILLDSPKEDTLLVQDSDGTTLLIMRAVQDENGDMVATDNIAPVVVAATFRNVAERHGKVDLRFDITVPSSMLDKRWQLRFQPRLYMMGDSTALDPVFITGEQYRMAQLRGYRRYQHFLDGIAADPTVFVRQGQLSIFMDRTSRSSARGVSRQQATEHYTDKLRRGINSWKESRKEEMFRRWVRSPILVDALRLDTIITASTGDILYRYVQTVNTRPGLRKAQITLDGSAFDEDRLVCTMPRSKALTFYISSLSTLCEDRKRFVTRIVERRASANSTFRLEFASGSAQLDTTLGDNAFQMRMVSGCLEELLDNEEFDMDSIIVQASCSPEGTFRFNERLCLERSESVGRHYSSQMTRGGVDIRFVPRPLPENWPLLNTLVEQDTLLDAQQKAVFRSAAALANPDEREARLQGEGFYGYLREKLYPRLRTVRFDFYLHRRGMLKDTLHTTVPDTLYDRGVQAIRDRDYTRAVEILRPYADWNTALAYCALEYNASALSVLEKLEPSAKVDYMKALIHSRKGETALAVQFYLAACEKDPAFVHRGNLDPEISQLKDKYNLSQKL